MKMRRTFHKTKTRILFSRSTETKTLLPQKSHTMLSWKEVPPSRKHKAFFCKRWKNSFLPAREACHPRDKADFADQDEEHILWLLQIYKPKTKSYTLTKTPALSLAWAPCRPLWCLGYGSATLSSCTWCGNTVRIQYATCRRVSWQPAIPPMASRQDKSYC